MNEITNALKAPFSTEAADASSAAKVAMVYGAIGIMVGVFFLGK